jgi:hypothetical protein
MILDLDLTHELNILPIYTYNQELCIVPKSKCVKIRLKLLFHFMINKRARLLDYLVVEVVL